MQRFENNSQNLDSSTNFNNPAPPEVYGPNKTTRSRIFLEIVYSYWDVQEIQSFSKTRSQTALVKRFSATNLMWLLGFPELKAPGSSRFSALWRCKVVTLTHRPVLPPVVFLVLIFRGWVDPRAHGSVGSFGKNPQRHHWGSIPRASD
jgi:hypothetical protein